jgi:hypothetical protein
MKQSQIRTGGVMKNSTIMFDGGGGGGSFHCSVGEALPN